MDKKYIVIGSILAVLMFGFFGFQLYGQRPQVLQSSSESSVQGEKISEASDMIVYQGREGVDALTLLTENGEIEAENGFVTSIYGRKANDSLHEFWAFYVNGKQAEVGAAEYLTKDSDLIEWKIETY